MLSVQFSCSVVSNSLWPHGLQHARLPCPSLAPGTYSNSCPLCHVVPCSHLILYHPLLLSPSILPSIMVFSNESVICIRWPKYWSFTFSISPCNYSGLISFRIDWFDLLAVHRTLNSLYHKRPLGSPCSSCEVKVSLSCPTLRPHGLYSSWDSPGQNTGVGSLSLLQGIFPTQWSNPGLPHRRQILYQLSNEGSSCGSS